MNHVHQNDELITEEYDVTITDDGPPYTVTMQSQKGVCNCGVVVAGPVERRK